MGRHFGDEGQSILSDSDDESDEEEFPHPPDGGIFHPDGSFGPADSIQALQNGLNKWAKSRGLAVIRSCGRNKRDGQCTDYSL